MTSWVVPSDTHVVSDTGHTTDHNHMADDLTLVNSALPVVSGGLTGATAATRFAGGTASGAPVSGTFAVGDFIIDRTGVVWVCTSAGTPGTWAPGLVNPMTTLGDVIFENGTPAPARLAGNTTSTRKFLRQAGTGTVSAAPAWDTLAAGDLPAATSSTQGAVLLPALTQGATVYVTTTGNDSNDGLSWQTAKLTVQAAVNALPTTSGIQGGIVEVGYGKFTSSTPVVIASTQNVWLRGRGPGQSFDSVNNQGSPVYTTELHNSGAGDAIQVTGPSNFGPAGSPANTGVVISDMAVTGTAGSNYGINATFTEGVRIENVNIDLHGVFGIRQSKVFGMLLRNVYISRCGTAGAAGPSGGHFLDPSLGANPGVNYHYSEIAFCNGYGIYDGGSPTTSTGLVLSHSVFQDNAASAKAASGVGLYSGGNWQAYGCDFEANALYGIYAESGGQGALFGCDILGDSVSASGIYNGHSAGSVLAVHGCRFSGNTTHGIDNTSANFISWTACVSSDPDFIYNGSSTNKVPADGFAPAVSGTTGSLLTGYSPQVLGSNGAVAFNASWGANVITLNANATSSSVPTGPPGQFLDLALVQGAGGSHTWAWPANVKFTGGAAPVISTTATWTDIFRFVSNGTNWLEVSRSLGVR